LLDPGTVVVRLRRRR